MEEIFKIIGIGIITCIACMIVKEVRPDISIIIAITGGIVIILMLTNYLVDIIGVFNSIVDKTSLNHELFSIILKIIGVGYLAEFAGSICADTGNSSLADKIVFGGKIIILAMSLPIITSIINIVVELIP